MQSGSRRAKAEHLQKDLTEPQCKLELEPKLFQSILSAKKASTWQKTLRLKLAQKKISLDRFFWKDFFFASLPKFFLHWGCCLINDVDFLLDGKTEFLPRHDVRGLFLANGDLWLEKKLLSPFMLKKISCNLLIQWMKSTTDLVCGDFASKDTMAAQTSF